MKINHYFTADPHYGHDNIRRFCDRPFDSWWEMNKVLIANHNAVVGPNDHVYFVGDFAFMNKGKIVEILKRLNGKKFMILGNHDKEHTNVVHGPVGMLHQLKHLGIRGEM